jgi:hypothetical protein
MLTPLLFFGWLSQGHGLSPVEIVNNVEGARTNSFTNDADSPSLMALVALKFLK